MQRLRRFLTHASIAGAGGFAFYYAAFTLTRFGPSYLPWAAWILLLFFVPLGAIIGGLIGAIAWGIWVATSGLPASLRALFAAVAAAVVGISATLVVWVLFNLEGPVALAGTIAGLIFGIAIWFAASGLKRPTSDVAGRQLAVRDD